jgi:hypothetical protein
MFSDERTVKELLEDVLDKLSAQKEVSEDKIAHQVPDQFSQQSSTIPNANVSNLTGVGCLISLSFKRTKGIMWNQHTSALNNAPISGSISHHQCSIQVKHKTLG